jgi:Icc-related predicted phosphoesterase
MMTACWRKQAEKKSMRALVFSDLHLGHLDLEYALDFPIGVDVAIVAGDIVAPIASSLSWLHENIVAKGIPTIFVAGNHEFYSFNLQTSTQDGLAVRDRYPGLHWLENEVVVIGDARFVGCTMWTDYALYERPGESMQVAMLYMNDHRLIYRIDDEGRRGRFYPEDALKLHQESRAWLEAELSRHFNGRTIVVTHHCPHPGSIHPRYAGDRLNPAFASDLSAIIENFQPDIWVHGHTHSSFDYMVARTRIVCNPRGYARKPYFGGIEVENRDFEPFKVIEF